MDISKIDTSVSCFVASKINSSPRVHVEIDQLFYYMFATY